MSVLLRSGAAAMQAARRRASAITAAFSGFVTSVDFASSAPDAASDIGADGCQYSVFTFSSLPAAASQVVLCHGTTTAGHLIQQLNTRTIRCGASF